MKNFNDPKFTEAKQAVIDAIKVAAEARAEVDRLTAEVIEVWENL